MGPGAAVHSPLATQNGFLRFLLRGCDLELFTSVLNGLGPFLEDEDVPVVVPMQIELLDCSVTLKVRGPCLPGLCSLGSVAAVSSMLSHSVESSEEAGCTLPQLLEGSAGKGLAWGTQPALLVKCAAPV